MQAELFSSEIKKFAQNLQFSVYPEDHTRAKILSIEGLWLTIVLDFTQDNIVFVYAHSRLTSWQLSGDRTDANELFPMLLAIFLRAGACNVSCELIDIPHPVDVPETEVYARYLVLVQPNGSVYSLTEEDADKIKHLLLSIRYFLGSFFYLLEIEDHDDIQWSEVIFDEAEENWAREVASAIGEPFGDEKIQFVRRQVPAWLHYRSIRSHITVYQSHKLANSLIDFVLQGKPPWQILPGINSMLYITESNSNIYNTISEHHSTKARRILKKLNNLEGGCEMICIPLENYLVAASGEYTIFIKADCSKRKFEGEKEKIRKRHDREARLLFPVSEFIWSDRIDDERFELFVLDLLKHDKAVAWARKVSGSNEPDGGRDVICEWNIPPKENENVSDERLDFGPRRIIVQCKAYQGSVGKSKVQDIRDTVEHHSARGYLLVVSSYLARNLTEHLEKLRSEGKIWVDWWTRSELEERLTQHRDLVTRYPDIVSIKSD